MAIGRTFRESFAKAQRSRELDAEAEIPDSDEDLLAALGRALPRSASTRSWRRSGAASGSRRSTRAASSTAGSCASWRRWRLEGDGTEGLVRTYRSVDTCAAEFEAATPYYYSAHERRAPRRPARSPRRCAATAGRESVVILGAGPNRIGQGIEFDYCCVHAAMTARELGRDAVMVNCNPETVSTDYDTSDRLYFEPLTDERRARRLRARSARRA